MSLIDAAIAEGRCALAVSGDLLNDAEIVLELREREALRPMALSGTVAAPMQAVADAGVARAIGQAGGVLAIVEPDARDLTGLDKLAKLLQNAPHKPTIAIVAQKYDQFRMMMTFRGFKLEHVKERGGKFLKSMPMPPAEEALPEVEVAKAKDRQRKGGPKAPERVFVGREDELATLQGFLGEGGCVVVSGPAGIGRRTLVDAAIDAAQLERLPELNLGRGVGFDALAARLAMITRDAGASDLADALDAKAKPAEVIAAAIRALEAADGLASKVMVVHHLEYASGANGEFFRKSRLELLLSALLVSRFPLRLVFTSAVQPVFFREGSDAALRRLTLDGIKGRFYHEIFAAMGVTEISRDVFGPLSEKLHGNPLAVRTAAVAVREAPKRLESDKWFRMADAGDAEVIYKQIGKALDALPAPLRGKLAMIAHLRLPVEAGTLTDLGINKHDRVALQSAGLLDVVGGESGRGYLVHDLVRRAMPLREASNRDLWIEASVVWKPLSEKAAGIEALALAQEANRSRVAGHRAQDQIPQPFPDHDALVDSCAGLLRSQSARPDIADMRLKEVLAANPTNSDAHLLYLELLRRSEAKPADRQAAADVALSQAPVNEVFHEIVGMHLHFGARSKAIAVLEQGIAEFPKESRLRTRVAALLMRDGRRPEALEHLQAAMDADPMLPDAYGLLGMARREEDKLDEAETLLREAVRLAPGDVVQTTRLIWLLVDVARGVPERAEAAREEVKELLDGLLQANKENFDVHLTFAIVLREEATDLGRARWFLTKARKLAPRRVSSILAIEGALLDIAEGKLDAAEKTLRKLQKAEPANPHVFGALARLFEARGLAIVAYQELTRAVDRTSPHGLDRARYERERARMQAVVESGGGLVAPVVELDSGADAADAADAPAEAAPAADAPADTSSAPVAPSADADPAAAAEDDAAADDDDGASDAPVANDDGASDLDDPADDVDAKPSAYDDL